MSFARTYAHTLAVALDDLGAAVLFNRNDVTLSALCGLERRADAGDAQGRAAIATLALRGWQRAFLRVTGRALELCWPGHCEAAIAADLARGRVLTGSLG